ncbi:hypothetical protein [Sorangium sp. So ce861]|uniref:hypothetical protein n=1 Tax=Sorangium sp. So ce861 TaxID=3133323 RepID=UPI003F6453E0
MKSRPLIALSVPRVVYPGATIDVGLALESVSETPIDFVRVTLQHAQQARDDVRGDPKRVACRDLLLLSEDVAGRGWLGEGIHRYWVQFALPADLPPSHAGYVVRRWCRVSALVAIPWWFDAEESKVVVVGRPAAPVPDDEPFASASPRGHGPFVEVSLPGRTFAPGELLTGAVAFGDLGGRRPFKLDVSLIGIARGLRRRGRGSRCGWIRRSRARSGSGRRRSSGSRGRSWNRRRASGASRARRRGARWRLGSSRW